jgi:hypothetical protein
MVLNTEGGRHDEDAQPPDSHDSRHRLLKRNISGTQEVFLLDIGIARESGGMTGFWSRASAAPGGILA